MKSLLFQRAKKSLCGRVLRRIAGEESGAVAMEYIVIALLVAAAVVGLVMVFGGNLRNMLDKTNQTMTSKKVSDVETVGSDYRNEQDKMKAENETAVKAGNELGADFTEARATQSGGGSGGGSGSGT